MVDAVAIDTPMGRSDYPTLLFSYTCYAEYCEAGVEKSYIITDYDVLSDLIKLITGPS